MLFVCVLLFICIVLFCLGFAFLFVLCFIICVVLFCLRRAFLFALCYFFLRFLFLFGDVLFFVCVFCFCLVMCSFLFAFFFFLAMCSFLFAFSVFVCVGPFGPPYPHLQIGKAENCIRFFVSCSGTSYFLIDQFKIALSTNSKKNSSFKLDKNVSVRKTFTE